MNLPAFINSFRIRLILLLAALLGFTLGVQYYVNLRAVRNNAHLIVEQQRVIMAGVALGVKSITSGQYLDEMRKEVNAPLLDEQTGRIQNILVVDDEGNVRDSLKKDYNPGVNSDESPRYVQVRDVPLPALNSAVEVGGDDTLPPGISVAPQIRAGDSGAFYFPVETEKGRRYVIVVLGNAWTSILRAQARRSLVYTLAGLLVTT